MTYRETLDFLFSSLPMYQRIGAAAYKADLNNAHTLDRYFDFPHRKYLTVHVAGTNGKGSVSHILASVLQEAGYKTGLYTSPHLLDFRERIKVNGDEVPEDYVVEFVEKHKAVFLEHETSFFEMTVFMAFEFFAAERVDVAVIEVGLGGRLDTTNVITPRLSVITNIGLDHTQILGRDLKTIAGEKAGIIKNNVPVVIGETNSETESIFIEKAKKENSAIEFADNNYRAEYLLRETDGKMNIRISPAKQSEGFFLKCDLIGEYQAKNCITALSAIDSLKKTGMQIPGEAIENGFSNIIKNTRISGRWQILQHNPTWVCDVGHNKEGISYIVNQLSNTPYKELWMIMGFVNDKDLPEITRILPRDAHYLLCEPTIPRAMKNEAAAIEFNKYNLDYQVCQSLDEACKIVSKKACENDLIFTGGSTFLVADLLLLKKNDISF